MQWLIRFMAGLLLWAVLFSVIYALHGAGCAWGWPARQTPLGSLHPLLMRLVWLAGLGLHLALMRLPSRHHGPRGNRLIRLGDWIGLTASVVTLLPLMTSSTCPA